MKEKSAQIRPPGAKNIVGKVAYVFVKSPEGVPDGTPVDAGSNFGALMTGAAGQLPLRRWNLLLSYGNRRWSKVITLTESVPATTPICVALDPASAPPVIRPLSQGPTSRSGDAGTVVYVHGIGNKPPADILCCQWDRALFGRPLAERSRLAYWVDRDRYPVPESGTCANSDIGLPGPAGMAARAAGLASPSVPPDRLIDALGRTAAERRTLKAIARRMEAASLDNGTPTRQARSSTPSARVLPGGRLARRWLSRWLTDLFLPDVHEYLFDEAARERMLDSLADRLRGGGEPFVVIGHSLGSVIAYEQLRRFKGDDCDVALFVTIGSPLGMKEIQDHLRTTGKLRTPECVRKWLNFSDPLDNVSIDASLGGEYEANARHSAEVEDMSVENTHRSDNPHSGSGYLATEQVRDAVREVTGWTFASPVARGSIASDLAAKSEAGSGGTLHDVLIQLEDCENGSPKPLAEASQQLVGVLAELTTTRPASIKPLEPPDVLRRFVAARLTRSEIEGLRTRARDLRIRLVWTNAEKRTMMYASAATTQALPAQLGYAATGRGIAWAVLDTGIDASHPHFAKHGNVRAQWDCLKRGAPRPIGPDAAGDPNGHGTHVAGIIAGEMSGIWAGRELRLAGMAPEAALYGFRVLGRDGTGSDSAIIKALDMIASMNESARGLVIHGVNLSLGSGFDPSVFGCGHTPLCQELRRLWRQGALVCLAAGNEGYGYFQSDNGEVALNLALSIGDPANLEEAIAVGSVHKENPHTYGTSYFSSRGPTADGRRKPDCVAPGERIVSARSGGRVSRAKTPDLAKGYVEMSGTSQATPHVSGQLAAFLSARREFIGDPDRAKRILLANCTDLGRDPNMQGAGLVNLVRMLLGT